nr:hypothetical protein [Tanacetum cinerariifolium]
GESDEEQEEEESFDPIPRTPEDSEKESHDDEEQESRLSEEARIQEEEDADELYRKIKEDQDLRLSKEARIQEEEDADELYRDVNINQGRGLQVTQNVKDTHVTLTPVNPDGPQESSSMSSFMSTFRFEERLRSLETSFSEYRQTNLFADAVSAIPDIVQQFITQQMTEAVREAVQIQTDRL